VPIRPQTSYAIKKPAQKAGRGSRRTFALQEVTGSARRTLKLEALDAINGQWTSGLITYDEALRQVTALRDSLYAERDATTPRLVFSSENLALLDRYWKAEYADRDLIDAPTMLGDLRRAVGAVGTLSLLAAPRTALQDRLNTTFADRPTLQRRAASRLNQLLRFAGRDFSLRKVKAPRPEPQYLTWSELEQVLPNLHPHFSLLARVAWITGCRAGEIFALTPSSLKAKHIFVSAQVDARGVRRDTKTRSERKVALLRPDGMDILRQWLAVPEADRAALRLLRHSVVLRRACRRAFPTTPSKWCRFHDLRHSYAVEMISRGVPVTLVAQSLGNSVAVCERYYSGFALQDQGIETIDRLLNSTT